MSFPPALRGTSDLRLAIVLDPGLSLGFLANTVATISVGLGAQHPGLGGVELKDARGHSISNSADRPVPILQSDAITMHQLLEKALATKDLTVVAFPAFARLLHSFAEYEDTFPTRTIMEEQIDGIGVCGPSKVVKSLTGSLKLLR